MKSLLIFITSLFFILFSFFFLSSQVFADGMLIRPDPFANRWDYQQESNQQAFINYENGLEKLIISIGFEEENTQGAVWLFPVPCDPKKIVIDVVKSLPQFSGEEISQKAKMNLNNTKDLLHLTQIYTLPFVLSSRMFGVATLGEGSSTPLGMKGFGDNIEQDVIVYEHLEKEGITSEVITARTATGLYDYLKSKDLPITSGSIPVLDYYIGKDFSFVASWIQPHMINFSKDVIEKRLQEYFEAPHRYPKLDIIIQDFEDKYPDFKEAHNKAIYDTNWYLRYEYLKSNPQILEELIQTIQKNQSVITNSQDADQNQPSSKQKGIFVTFSTDKLYYPLLPTSVYGSKTIPTSIRIINYATPEIFADIKGYTKIGYFSGYYNLDDPEFDTELKNFFGKEGKNIKYTKIDINAPAKFLTRDLWISKRTPLRSYYTSYFVNHPLANTIILLILTSLLTGVIVGLVIFKEARNKKDILKYGRLGLFNCLSLFGLLIATLFSKTKDVADEETMIILKQLRCKGYFLRRKIALILILLALPFFFLPLSIIWTLISNLFSGYGLFYYLKEQLVTFLMIIIFVVIVIKAKTVKQEDKPYFDQLKTKGYSTWTFQPKDGRKFVFIPLYSISFLIISWLLIKTIGLTV